LTNALSTVDWHKVARLVLLSREIDHLEEEQLAPQGKVKYQFSSQGHELAQVLLAQAFTHPPDAAAVYYRSRPFMLACGLTPAEALAADMARAGSPSEGRDVGVVFNLPRRGGPTVLPGSGDVGAQYTPAAGWAQAITYRQRVLGEADWHKAISAALGGDGSVAANGFWAALNIATTQRLPMLIFIEDNHYGISVPAALQTPGGNIAANLAAFGNLKLLDGDGTDPEEAWQLISTAVGHVRSGEGPCLLRLQVPRLKGHTLIDDQSYKTAEERAAEAARDPLIRLREYLINRGILSTEDWGLMEQRMGAELASALETALASPEPDVRQALTHLFFVGLPPQQGGLRPENAQLSINSTTPEPRGPRLNLIDAVRRTLESEMAPTPGCSSSARMSV
jgi:2-oxoisovalerate dehydrogenase E1 component